MGHVYVDDTIRMYPVIPRRRIFVENNVVYSTFALRLTADELSMFMWRRPANSWTLSDEYSLY